jgi:hypothetical protein
MSKTMGKPRKRLTREESRAQTRAALIAVGRDTSCVMAWAVPLRRRSRRMPAIHEVRFISTSTARRIFSLL